MATIRKTWKKVTPSMLNVASSGGGIGYSSNTSWYDELMSMSVSRQALIDRYDDMDNTVDISRALDIMAEDISSDDMDKNRPFDLSFNDDIKTTQVKTMNRTLDQWIEDSEIDYELFDIVRAALKYGIFLAIRNKDFTYSALEQKRIVGYVLDKKDRNKVTHYLYDESKELKDVNGDVKKKEGDDIVKIPVSDLLVVKIGKAPMGESVLARVYRVWRQLNLLEDAVVIYRIVRAPERRVFYIATGNLSGTKAEAYLNRVKAKMRQKQLLKDNSNLETQYNPASTVEDYFIAQPAEGEGSRVETLPGGDNLGRIEDLVYFGKRLSHGLRVPPSYLDSFSDNEGTYNDGRVGTAYLSEMRYANYIARLQKKMSKVFLDEFILYCASVGVEIPENMKLVIEPPQNFALYKEAEINSMLLNVYSSADSMEGLSKYKAIEKFLGYDKTEIQENTDAKLVELGIDPKIIKKMPDHVKINLVYGDQEAGQAWVEERLAEEDTVEGTSPPAEEELPPKEAV